LFYLSSVYTIRVPLEAPTVYNKEGLHVNEWRIHSIITTAESFLDPVFEASIEWGVNGKTNRMTKRIGCVRPTSQGDPCGSYLYSITNDQMEEVGLVELCLFFDTDATLVQNQIRQIFNRICMKTPLEKKKKNSVDSDYKEVASQSNSQNSVASEDGTVVQERSRKLAVVEHVSFDQSREASTTEAISSVTATKNNGQEEVDVMPVISENYSSGSIGFQRLHILDISVAEICPNFLNSNLSQPYPNYFMGTKILYSLPALTAVQQRARIDAEHNYSIWWDSYNAILNETNRHEFISLEQLDELTLSNCFGVNPATGIIFFVFSTDVDANVARNEPPIGKFSLPMKVLLDVINSHSVYETHLPLTMEFMHPKLANSKTLVNLKVYHREEPLRSNNYLVSMTEGEEPTLKSPLSEEVRHEFSSSPTASKNEEEISCPFGFSVVCSEILHFHGNQHYVSDDDAEIFYTLSVIEKTEDEYGNDQKEILVSERVRMEQLENNSQSFQLCVPPDVKWKYENNDSSRSFDFVMDCLHEVNFTFDMNLSISFYKRNQIFSFTSLTEMKDRTQSSFTSSRHIKATDILLGRSVIDLSLLSFGIPQINGFYHIFNDLHKYIGQIKVEIALKYNGTQQNLEQQSFLNITSMLAETMKIKNEVEAGEEDETESIVIAADDSLLSFRSLDFQSLKQKMDELDQVNQKLLKFGFQQSLEKLQDGSPWIAGEESKHSFDFSLMEVPILGEPQENVPGSCSDQLPNEADCMQTESRIRFLNPAFAEMEQLNDADDSAFDSSLYSSDFDSFKTGSPASETKVLTTENIVTNVVSNEADDFSESSSSVDPSLILTDLDSVERNSLGDMDQIQIESVDNDDEISEMVPIESSLNGNKSSDNLETSHINEDFRQDSLSETFAGRAWIGSECCIRNEGNIENIEENVSSPLYDESMETGDKGNVHPHDDQSETLLDEETDLSPEKFDEVEVIVPQAHLQSGLLHDLENLPRQDMELTDRVEDRVDHSLIEETLNEDTTSNGVELFPTQENNDDTEKLETPPVYSIINSTAGTKPIVTENNHNATLNINTTSNEAELFPTRENNEGTEKPQKPHVYSIINSIAGTKPIVTENNPTVQKNNFPVSPDVKDWGEKELVRKLQYSDDLPGCFIPTRQMGEPNPVLVLPKNFDYQHFYRNKENPHPPVSNPEKEEETLKDNLFQIQQRILSKQSELKQSKPNRSLFSKNKLLIDQETDRISKIMFNVLQKK
jgi:hypothetical protein